jgi:hypothetical protein
MRRFLMDEFSRHEERLSFYEPEKAASITPEDG